MEINIRKRGMLNATVVSSMCKNNTMTKGLKRKDEDTKKKGKKKQKNKTATLVAHFLHCITDL